MYLTTNNILAADFSFVQLEARRTSSMVGCWQTKCYTYNRPRLSSTAVTINNDAVDFLQVPFVMKNIFAGSQVPRTDDRLVR